MIDRVLKRARILPAQCGNSSAGRAIPCQGIGREFEPRFPLHITLKKGSVSLPFFNVISVEIGALAKWLCRGLQSLRRRFDSGTRLQ